MGVTTILGNGRVRYVIVDRDAARYELEETRNIDVGNARRKGVIQ
jgi:hypothetical protein